MPASARRSVYLIETYWAASIAVMDQPTAMDGSPRMKCLFHGIENKAGMGCPAHPPADDAAGMGVDDKGDVDEASPSGHVGKVRDPQPIRCRSVELAIDLVERARRGLVADCRADRLAADHPLQAHLPHKQLNSAASDIEAFPLQLPPHLAHAIDTEVLFEDASDLTLRAISRFARADSLAGSRRLATWS